MADCPIAPSWKAAKGQAKNEKSTFYSNKHKINLKTTRFSDLKMYISVYLLFSTIHSLVAIIIGDVLGSSTSDNNVQYNIELI